MFLLMRSKDFIPLFSILIKYKPKKPIINGNIKLKVDGKKPVILDEKREFKKTSKTPIKNNAEPKYKNVFKFSLSGFIKFIFDINYFSLIAIFLLYQFIKIEIEILKLK